jgi:hypothetical protein
VSAHRIVRPEQLDLLPHAHPAALRSRRDLVRINRVMGNWRWLRTRMLHGIRSSDTILELGAGDGAFARWLRRDPSAVRAGWRVRGLDLVARPVDWPTAWPWTRGDMLDPAVDLSGDVVLANLVLHHFEDAALERLGRRLRETARLVLVCEPARGALNLAMARSLALIGAGPVTRYDAPVSVQAGFAGTELPEIMGFAADAWKVDVRTGLFGAYRMIAQRRVVEEAIGP